MFTSFDVRGVLRGRCSFNNCECDSFTRSSSPDLSGTSNTSLQCGWCCYCGHPPTSHSRVDAQYAATQRELPLTGGKDFVNVKCKEGNKQTDSSAPAPKRRHFELEAPSVQPDLVQGVEQIKKETEELRNQLPGEEKSDYTQDIMQHELPLTVDEEFVVEEDIRGPADSAPEEVSEETNAGSSAPKQVAVVAPAPEPDLAQTVAQLERETEHLRKQLRGEEKPWQALQEHILKVLDHVREMMDSQIKTLRRLQGKAAELCNELAAEPVDSNILKLLPLSSQQSLQQLEEHLSVVKNRADLVAYLSGVHTMDYVSRADGPLAKNGIPHLMRRCMRDEFAQEFSFMGRKGKHPFNCLHLCQVITDTFLRNYPATEFRAHHAIADWLRNAPGRQRERVSAASLRLHPELGTSLS